jgi:hypothetical protein
MPFKSAKQRRYLYAEKPEVAKKFAMDSAKKGKMTKLRTGGPQDRGQEAKSQEKGFDHDEPTDSGNTGILFILLTDTFAITLAWIRLVVIWICF